MVGGADRWAAHAADQPDRVAIVAGSARTTYGELVARTHAVGRWLLDHGVAPGARVALVVREDPDLLAAIGGVLAIGAVPVTIDERATIDEVHRSVDGTDATALVHSASATAVATRALKRIQRPWRPALLDFDAWRAADVVESEAWEPPDGAPGTVVLVGPSPRSAAPITRLDTHTLHDETRASGPDHDTHLVVAPLAHGPGLVGALTTLGAGGTLVLPSPGWSGDDVLAAVERERVTRVTVDAATEAWGRAVHDAFPMVTVVQAATKTRDAEPTDADGTTSTRPTIDTPGGPVALGAVEARIAAHRGVAVCRVVALATRTGPPALIGLVVVEDGHYLDAAELRATARSKLSAHETPRAWLLVDTIDPDATDADLRAIALARLRVPEN